VSREISREPAWPEPVLPPGLGGHDPPALRPVPSRVVATWPVGTFVENLAALPTGGLVVSVLSRSEVELISPDGSRRVLATTPAPPAGIVASDEACFVLAGEPGRGPYRVLQVGLDGQLSEWVSVPDARFLNGFTLANPGTGYAVDSMLGQIVRIDLDPPGHEVVLAHELLAKTTSMPEMPAVNGVKRRDDELILTNTERALALRAPLGANGPTGEVEVIAERLRGDDLAIGADGGIYVTTHIHNSLVRLGPDGGRVAIAGPDQGMAGSTACAFGALGGLYVTTTGGIVMPLNGVTQPAKLVRLDVPPDGGNAC
jgi:sugar lactone lactonase YvrE